MEASGEGIGVGSADTLKSTKVVCPFWLATWLCMRTCSHASHPAAHQMRANVHINWIIT